MKTRNLHDWSLKPGAAIELQTRLAPQVIHDQPLNIGAIKLVAGVDVSVKNNQTQAAVVTLTYPEFEVIETALAQRAVSYPYVPGLLSFREGPVLLDAFRKLEHEPDVFIFDGMGRIHPRKIGIASHMGLWLDKPTIGCGKSHLIGYYELPGNEKGAYSLLSYQDEILGAVLRTRASVKPVYISVGHRADLSSAIQFILHCAPKYRLPIPIRMAHKAAAF